MHFDINNYRSDTEAAHWYGKWTEIVKKHSLIRFCIVLYSMALDKQIIKLQGIIVKDILDFYIFK